MKSKPKAKKKTTRHIPMPRTKIDKMYYAIADYVKSAGGDVIMAGPVSIEKDPRGPKYHYVLRVHCTGTPPKRQFD